MQKVALVHILQWGKQAKQKSVEFSFLFLFKKYPLEHVVH